MYSKKTLKRHKEKERSPENMDKEALKKLEEQLKCAVCLETFSEPKVLKCHHVFCKECLTGMWDKEKRTKKKPTSLNCPSCRKDTTVDQEGEVNALSPAFHINCLLDLKDSFTKVQDDHTNDTNCEADGKVRSYTCSEHNSKEFELYCDTCSKLICSHCVFRGEKHHSHEYEVISTCFLRHLDEISTSLEPVQRQLDIVEEGLSKLDPCREEVIQRQAVVQEEIRKQIQELHKVLEAREAILISNLQDITQRKLKGIATQKDNLTTTQAQLTSCLEFVTEKLKFGDKAEVLNLKTIIIQQAKDLNQAFHYDWTKLRTNADMVFLESPNVAASCQNFGEVISPGLPCPHKSLGSGSGLSMAEVGKTQTVTVQAINFKHRPCEEPFNSLQSELISEATGIITETTLSVANQKLGMYVITFCPTVRGDHKLEIKIENQHITGSPFSVHVMMPISRLGTQYKKLRGVDAPRGIAIAKNGDIFVTEYYKHHISVLKSNGQKLRSFGTCGNGNGELEYPQGLALDEEDNILVADCDNHRIQKLTADGNFMASVGTKGTGSLQFCYPTDLALNHKNNKIYVIDSNCRVQILNSDFSYFGTFGKKGKRDGQFSSPSGVSCDSSGKVYVSDYNKNDVQVFGPDGRFLRYLQKSLNRPSGIAIDSDDNVYVAEDENHVSVIDANGTFVTTFDIERGGASCFRNAMAVSTGMLYVCNGGNSDCIQVF